MKKIVIPTTDQRRLKDLESENAELWFDNLALQSQVVSNKQEVADIWFAVIAGGGK